VDHRVLGLGRGEPGLELSEGRGGEVRKGKSGGSVLLDEGVVRLEDVARGGIGGCRHGSAGMGRRASGGEMIRDVEAAEVVEHVFARWWGFMTTTLRKMV